MSQQLSSSKKCEKAFETAFNFLEQNNIQADYNELKALKSLKKKIKSYSSKFNTNKYY